MDKLKKERLQKKGWKVGDVDEFLGLSPAEMAIVEMKVALAKALVAKRKSLGETQVSAAIIAKTSQENEPVSLRQSGTCGLQRFP